MQDLPADAQLGRRRTDPAGGRPVADQLSLRRSNLSVVLRVLARGGPRSRARIADDTGLTKATVSSLVSELVERGLLREGPPLRSTVGRPASLVEVRGEGAWGIGVEVTVDHLAVMAVDLAGRVLESARVALDAPSLSPHTVLEQIGQRVRARISAAPAGTHLAGVTVALPGMVDVDRGTLTYAPNLAWRDVSVLEALRAQLDPAVALCLDNEANLAALAELRAGASAGTHDLLLLVGGIGVGGGIISQGRLLRGGRGYGGEVGHMSIDPAGEVCACGRRGCWETVVGLGALLQAAAGDGRDVLLDPARRLDDRLDELRRRAEAGDPRTLDALTHVGRWLGLGAGLLVNVLDPCVVVLGGYFAALGPWLLDPVRAQLDARVIAAGERGCRVETSVLGVCAAVRGAALTALETVLDDPTVVPPAGSSRLLSSAYG